MTVYEDEREAAAVAIGNSRRELRRRLWHARDCLADFVRVSFKSGKFDFAAKRLVSDNGEYALQWTTRPKPDEPVSYNNQQTSIGCVTLKVLKDDRETVERLAADPGVGELQG